MAQNFSILDKSRSNDFVYYNCTIPHNDNNNPYSIPTPAIFSDPRTEAILDKPYEYDAGIVRFSCPTSEIPIFISAPIDFTENRPIYANGNVNPNMTFHSITLQYGSTIVQSYIQWTPDAATGIFNYPAILSATNPSSAFNDPYYYLKSYQHYINLINTAIYCAYWGTSWTGSAAAMAGAPAPFLVYNSETGLISIVAHESFGGSGTVNLYMNTPLYELFNPSFETVFNGFNAANGMNYQIIFQNRGNNIITNLTPAASGYGPPPSYVIPIGGTTATKTQAANAIFNPPNWDSTITYFAGDYVYYPSSTYWYLSLLNNNLNQNPVSATTYWAKVQISAASPTITGNFYVMEQEFSTLSSWNDFTSLVFMTSSIPIKKENIGIQSDNGQPIQLPIFTDFEVHTDVGNDLRRTIEYFPQGPYRMTSLNGNSPLKNIDLRIYWTDNFSNLYPLMIPSHLQATVKILFRRKDANQTA